MSGIWDRFKAQPRNRVDTYIFQLAVIAVTDRAAAERMAAGICPDFTADEISELVNLNLDMVRPENPELTFNQWCDAWSDALFAGIPAVGPAAKDALLQRVLASGRDCARLGYFSCTLKTLKGQEPALMQADFARLAQGIRRLDYLDVFETADLNDWMRDLGSLVPEGGDDMLDALKALWFSSEPPELMRIEDYSDADHDAFSLATAIVYYALWYPGYADYIADDLRRIAQNDFFPLTLNPDDPGDNPPEGAARNLKIQAMVGAAFAMLEREPLDAAWLDICLSYANSPAEDTRDAFAQWRPVVADKFPQATRLIDLALE